MPNFSDPAITQASNIAQQAQANATAQAKAAASGAANAATGMVTEAASKAAASVESAIAQATSAVSSAVSQASSAISSVTGALSSLTSAAQSALSSALGGLATGSGTTPFALPTFLSKPDATIGVKDVYGVTNNAVENLAEIAGSGLSSALTSAVQGTGGLDSALSALTQNADGSLSVDPAALTDRIKDALGGSTAALNRVGDSVLSTATNAASGPTSALMTTFDSTISNATNSFSAANIEDAKGLFSAINQLTNNSQMAQYFDVGAEASLLTGLFQEAVNLGLPEAITVLSNNANSTAAANQALKNITNTALSTGDLTTVNLLVDQLGSGQILAIQPQAAAIVLQGYTMPKGTASSQYSATGTALLNALNALDPAWSTTQRGDGSVSDLSCFSRMSNDARTVLQAEGTYAVPILIASRYPHEPWLTTIAEMYPLSPLVFRIH